METKQDAPKRQSFRSQYGRKGITVPALIPTFALRRKLGNVHVSTPDAGVERLVREAPGIRNDPRWTPKMIEEAVRFALWQHHENRAEYRAVMSGTVGR